VDRAITKALARDMALPDRFLEPVVTLVRELLASAVPTTRRDGYAIAMNALHGRGITSTTILNGLRRERDIRALRAALNLLDATLEHDPDRWIDRRSFTKLDRVLGDLAKPNTAPDKSLGRRALESRCVLLCRCCPLDTNANRQRNVDLVCQLILDAGDHELLGPVSRLMSRLANTHPAAAGDLLVEASKLVHTLTVADSTNSWKARRARRWRPGISDVVTALPYGTWKRILTQLAAYDPQIFAQAVEISIQERSENVERHIRSVIGSTNQDERVNAIFKNAQTRKQRIVGGMKTWPELLDAWLDRNAPMETK